MYVLAVLPDASLLPPPMSADSDEQSGDSSVILSELFIAALGSFPISPNISNCVFQERSALAHGHPVHSPCIPSCLLLPEMLQRPCCHGRSSTTRASPQRPIHVTQHASQLTAVGPFPHLVTYADSSTFNNPGDRAHGAYACMRWQTLDALRSHQPQVISSTPLACNQSVSLAHWLPPDSGLLFPS